MQQRCEQRRTGPIQAKLSHSALGHNRRLQLQNQVAFHLTIAIPDTSQPSFSISVTALTTPSRRHQTSLRGPGREDFAPNPPLYFSRHDRPSIATASFVRDSATPLLLLLLLLYLPLPISRCGLAFCVRCSRQTITYAGPFIKSNIWRGDLILGPRKREFASLRLLLAHTCHNDG